MKTKLYLFIFILIPWLGNAQVIQLFERNVRVNPSEILIFNEGNSIRNPEILNNGTGDPDVFSSLVAANLETLSLEIPIEGTNYILNLFKSKVFSDDFVLKTSDKGIVSLPDVKTYTGTVEGHNSKMVAITLYASGLEGLIEIDGNIYTLSKVANTDYHVIYKDRNVTYSRQINIENDTDINPTAKDINRSPEKSTNAVGCKVLRVYIEVDYTLYTSWGGTNSAVSAKLATVFNASKGYYQNENIDIELSSSLFWTNNDNYGASSIDLALINFRTHWNNLGNSFQGDVAHLFTNKYGGGYAALNVIQTTGDRAYAHGVDGAMLAVGTNFANYAQNVIIFTHELGHNIGSVHTQDCSWPGGPIDNCFPIENIYSIPNCAPGPGPAPINGGTVMSYCHISPTSTPYTTILTNGFGPLPGNLIRSKILSSTTLQTIPPPAPSYSGNTNICAVSRTSLTGLGCTNGSFKWYDVATGGTSLFTGSTFLTAFLQSNRTYYVECVMPDCISQRTPILISVTNPAGPPLTNTTKCGSGSKVIVTSGCSGGVLNWYSAAFGNTIIGTGNLFLATGLQVNNTYTYWSKCVVGSCTGVATPHTINVVPSAVTPIVAPVTICAGTTATLINTAACTGVIKWHNTNIADPDPPNGINSSGNTASITTPSSIVLGTGNSFTTPLLTSNTTYWVNCSGTCSSSLVPVVVTVLTTASPVVSTPVTISAGSMANLSATGCASGAIVMWYTSTALNSNVATGANYTTPVINVPTNYYVRCSLNGCFSSPVTSVVLLNNCLPIRILGALDNINAGVVSYEVSNHIKSTSIISGGIVKYDAANFIELLPGFKASGITGSSFKAIIDGCGGQ